MNAPHRLRDGIIKRIHVDRHAIARNRKTGGDEPVVTIKTSGSNDRAHEAVIVDAAGVEVARVVYRPEKPLSCGAVLWIESTYPVVPVLRADANAVPAVPSQA